MGAWVVEQLVLAMARRSMVIAGAKVLVLGLTFKENCPDLRNTRVVDLIQALQRYGIDPLVVDPWVDPEEAQRQYGLTVFREIPPAQGHDAVVAAVAHQQFEALSADHWRALLAPTGVLVDLKGIAPRDLGALRL